MPSIVAAFVDLRNVHPFIKWAGGKSQLLSELDKLIPNQFNRYFEPFLGGGAMFFYLMSRSIRFNACLSDTNVELITAYTAVKNNVKEVIRVLQTYETEYKKYPRYSRINWVQSAQVIRNCIFTTIRSRVLLLNPNFLDMVQAIHTQSNISKKYSLR